MERNRFGRVGTSDQATVDAGRAFQILAIGVAEPNPRDDASDRRGDAAARGEQNAFVAARISLDDRRH